jgi:hypothetical protein
MSPTGECEKIDIRDDIGKAVRDPAFSKRQVVAFPLPDFEFNLDRHRGFPSSWL